MARKSVGSKSKRGGLKSSSPAKRRRRNAAAADNRKHGMSASARRIASGRGSDAARPKLKGPRAVRVIATDEGSELDRRVGHGRDNVKRVQSKKRVKPDTMATKPGAPHGNRPIAGKHTARRNVKLNTAGMTAMLEDSANGKPSRKLTRKSANRQKENQLTRRVQRKAHSPESRAARGA